MSDTLSTSTIVEGIPKVDTGQKNDSFWIIFDGSHWYNQHNENHVYPGNYIKKASNDLVGIILWIYSPVNECMAIIGNNCQ